MSMYIEKINNSLSKNKSPGLVDIFIGDTTNCYSHGFVKNINHYYSSLITKHLDDANILLGKQFGSNGLTVTELLANKYTLNESTFFEMDINTYLSCPTVIRNMLLQYNIIVHDYMEGGWFLSEHKIPEEFTVLTGSANSIPIFMLCTMANSRATGNVNNNLDMHRNKLALVPIHKPRPWRLDVLAALDDRDLLDRCDWSLWFNLGDEGAPGDFAVSPNVSKARWGEHVEHPFVKKHFDVLPKQLDVIDHFDDCLPLHTDYHNQYRWHIVAETYMTNYFATEKTFKAFIGGHVPLTVAKPGFNKCLEDLGFIMPGNYDHLEGNERIDAIVDMVAEDTNDYTDVIVHNHDIIINHADKIVADCIKKRLCPSA
jgi:hypothetical protein